MKHSVDSGSVEIGRSDDTNLLFGVAKMLAVLTGLAVVFLLAITS